MKLKYFLCASVMLLLGFRPAAAAIKSCDELKREIEAKLAAKGITSYQLKIVEKAEEAPQELIIGKCVEPSKEAPKKADVYDCGEKGADDEGKTVGSCENSSKKIMYIRQETVPSNASAKPMKQGAAPAPEQDKAAAAEEALLATEMRQADERAQGIKPCPELKAEIEAKLKAHKVKSYELNIVGKHDKAPGKIAGTCENSSKKIMYIKK